jgi:hypothetical protein
VWFSNDEKVKESAREPSVLCWFFHETIRFWGELEAAKFFDSDFLKGKKRTRGSLFCGIYLMNRRFFENCTTLLLQWTITSILHFGVFYTCMAYMADSCHRSRALWPPLPSERELVVCSTVAGSRRTIAALVWFGLGLRECTWIAGVAQASSLVALPSVSLESESSSKTVLCAAIQRLVGFQSVGCGSLAACEMVRDVEKALVKQ